MIARHGTASHMEKLVGKFHHVQQQSDRRRDNEEESARKLVYYQDDQGMWVIHASLTPETGEQVIKALEAVVTPLQAERQKEMRETCDASDAQATRHPSSHISAETSAQSLAHLAAGVDADTTRPHWTGERMDYRMAVNGLLRRTASGG